MQRVGTKLAREGGPLHIELAGRDGPSVSGVSGADYLRVRPRHWRYVAAIAPAWWLLRAVWLLLDHIVGWTSARARKVWRVSWSLASRVRSVIRRYG